MMIRDVILFCQSRPLALWLYNVTNESYFLKGKIVQINVVPTYFLSERERGCKYVHATFILYKDK